MGARGGVAGRVGELGGDVWGGAVRGGFDGAPVDVGVVAVGVGSSGVLSGGEVGVLVGPGAAVTVADWVSVTATACRAPGASPSPTTIVALVAITAATTHDLTPVIFAPLGPKPLPVTSRDAEPTGCDP